jgi:undecaprenyl-diphosphatase
LHLSNREKDSEQNLLQLIKTIILGIIQGFTEWLPISSTGHLRLVEYIFGMSVPILFDVILHVGTLTVVLFFFRGDVKRMLRALTRFDFRSEHGQLVPLVIVGVIPTLAIGLFSGWLIEAAFREVIPIGVALLFCGMLLYSTKAGKEKTEKISYSVAIVIGIAQGVAIVPGISRSGATIAVALLLGVQKKKAFKFSFLLSVPAILGALLLTLSTEFDALTSAGLGWAEILAGVAVSMFVGYLALKLLWKTVAKGKFHLFAFYCWLLGVALIIFSIM